MDRELLDQTHERMQAIGLSDPRITVASVAAILGARQVLAIHGASPEVLRIEYKAKDGDTPKTVADIESGKAIKNLIRGHYPKCRINEEETGDEKARDGDQDAWHVDPLDGTSSFARELRYSTVGIAIRHMNSPFAGVIVNPFERELVVAQVDKGTRLFILDEDFQSLSYKKQVEVSEKTLKESLVYVDGLPNEKTTDRKLRFMRLLVRRAGGSLAGYRMSGSNIDQQMKVALGRAEASLTDAVGGSSDLFCGEVPITEAGGKFTTRYNKPVTEDTQVAVGTNGHVHDDVLELVRKCYQGYRGFR